MRRTSNTELLSQLRTATGAQRRTIQGLLRGRAAFAPTATRNMLRRAASTKVGSTSGS